MGYGDPTSRVNVSASHLLDEASGADMSALTNQHPVPDTQRPTPLLCHR